MDDKHHRMWPDLKHQALFGLVDGLNGAVGLVIGLLSSHAAAPLILVALMARAGSSSVSMAGAEYQADDTSLNARVRTGRVVAMGVGYLIAALLPGLGFAFSIHVGILVFIPATVVLLLVTARFRSKQVGWPEALSTTLVIFALAVGAGLLASTIGGS